MKMNNREHLLDLVERYIEEAVAYKQLNRESVHALYHLESAMEIKQFLETEEQAFGSSCHLGHITASAWIVNSDGNQVLLTHHKRLDRWLQLGGHTEMDEQIEEACLREAQEESGLDVLEFIYPTIFDLDVHDIPERGQNPLHKHYDIRFLLRSSSELPIKISDESYELKWINLDEVEKYAQDPSILRMIKKTSYVLK